MQKIYWMLNAIDGGNKSTHRNPQTFLQVTNKNDQQQLYRVDLT